MSRVVTQDSADESHVVQFYEHETALVDSLCGRIASSLAMGRRVVIVATRSRRLDIEKALAERNVDLRAARMRNQYADPDAAFLLSKILAGAQPDPGSFHSVIGGLLAGRPGGGVWIFSEMVALLRACGMYEAALRLDTLWNELPRKYGVSLYCAYPLLRYPERAREPQPVCAAPPSLIPGESFTLASSSHRLRIIEQLRRKTLLRREQENSRLFDFDSPDNGRYWLGLDGRILWANEMELNLLGYGRDEYIGRHISEFHSETEAAADILQRLRSNEVLYDYPVMRRCKNGMIKSMLMYSTGLWKWRKVTYICCLTRIEKHESPVP